LEELRRIAFADPREMFDSEGNLLEVRKWPAEIARRSRGRLETFWRRGNPRSEN